jgi:putative peptidoglycan lipid II flippase
MSDPTGGLPDPSAQTAAGARPETSPDPASPEPAVAALSGPDGTVPEVGGSSVRRVVGSAAVVIVAATLLSRVFGLVRDIATAHFFGSTHAADAFFLAYKVPYLVVLMVSGALTATFVPVLTYRIATGRKKEAWELSVNLGNIIFLTLLGVAVIFTIIAPYLVWVVGGFGVGPETARQATFLLRILMIGLVFDSIAGLFVGMLNSLKRFALAAFSPAIGTIATVIVLLALARPLSITALAIGSVVGSVAGCLLMLLGLRDQGISYTPRVKWRDPAVREVGGMVWPVLLGSAVGKISIFSDQIMASILVTGAISSLNYADKLFQMPLALFVAGITVPIFPLLSEQVAANSPDRVKATLNFALRLMGFLMIPATVGIILLRYPLIGAIYRHGEFTAQDAWRTSWVLMFECLGLYFYAGRDTLTRVFYSYHDTRTPVKISAATVFLNIAISFGFMSLIRSVSEEAAVSGLTLGTTVALTVNFFVLVYLLHRKIGQIGLRALFASLLRVVSISAVMGVVVWAVDFFLTRVLPAETDGYVVRLIVGIVLGGGVYLLLARLFRLPEFAEISGMLGAVFRRVKGSGRA